MLFSEKTFIGIDPTASRHPFTYAALDQDCKLIALAAGELDEVLAFLGGQPTAVVAVNAPPRPNLGLVRRPPSRRSVTSPLSRGINVLAGFWLLLSPSALTTSSRTAPPRSMT